MGLQRALSEMIKVLLKLFTVLYTTHHLGAGCRGIQLDPWYGLKQYKGCLYLIYLQSSTLPTTSVLAAWVFNCTLCMGPQRTLSEIINVGFYFIYLYSSTLPTTWKLAQGPFGWTP